MCASLKESGKLAVVLDTGAVSRGSGNSGSNREREIRKQFVERDWVEAESAHKELDYTSAAGVAFVRDHLQWPAAAGSFEEGMGA